jgi:hypothetical protein
MKTNKSIRFVFFELKKVRSVSFRCLVCNAAILGEQTGRGDGCGGVRVCVVVTESVCLILIVVEGLGTG